MGAARILLIEDDESYVNSVRLMLREHPVEIAWMPTGARGIQAYRKNTLGYATVIVDYILPDLKGSEVAQQIKRINPAQDILFASGHTESNYLTDMLISGSARSFLVKGRSIQDMRDTILTSLRLYENKNRVVGVDDYSPEKAEKKAAMFGFIGRSRAAENLSCQVPEIRKMPVNVRIIGESGTGKEIVAKALVPDGQKMIAIACPELNSSENAFESDLFGHVKGAFTGADTDKPGLLLQAHKNVLFLDEVHTLSMTNQQKFLRFLQEMKFRRKNDEKGALIPVDFRLISAAKPEIHQLIKEERFLEDLYFRLGVVDIYIPPLRERPEDIEPLVRHIQDKYNHTALAHKPSQFRISTIREMEKHTWRGNVRELDGAIFTMMFNAKTDIVNPSNFDDYLKAKAAQLGKTPVRTHDNSMSVVADQVIRDQIIKALKTSRSQQETSEKLGIHRSKLVRSLKRLGIQSEAYLRKSKMGEILNVT